MVIQNYILWYDVLGIGHGTYDAVLRQFAHTCLPFKGFSYIFFPNRFLSFSWKSG